MTILRNIGLGLASAVVAGVLDGGVARVLMRGVALATDQLPAFSVVATLGIMLVFTVTAVPLAVTAELTTRRGARRAAGVVGTAVLGFFAVSIGLQEVTGADGLDALQWVSLLACVVGLAAVVVLQPLVVMQATRRRRTRPVAVEPAAP